MILESNKGALLRFARLILGERQIHGAIVTIDGGSRIANGPSQSRLRVFALRDVG
jgi:hypothetical protein